MRPLAQQGGFWLEQRTMTDDSDYEQPASESTRGAKATAGTDGPSLNPKQWVTDLPRWKKISLLAAGAVIVTGGVLMLVDPGGATAPASSATPGGTSGAGSALQSGLMPEGGGGTGGTGTPAPAEEPTAKGIFRLGFSFVVGFALGSFLRTTIRFAAIAFGFWLAATLVLAYYDLLVVNWQGIDDLWTHFMTAIESEWQSFQSFVTGSLPAAALVATGFFVGFKR